MIIVNGFQPLTIITKCSILDVAAALDPPLNTTYKKLINTHSVKYILLSSQVSDLFPVGTKAKLVRNPSRQLHVQS